MPHERIEHITWIRAQLKLRLSDVGEGTRFVIVSKMDPFVWYPLTHVNNTLTLFLPNVTGLSGKEMLPGGCWFFATLDEDGQLQPMTISDAARKDLSSLEREFPYDKKGHLYCVELAAEGSRGKEACTLRVSFARKDARSCKERSLSWITQLPAKIADGYLKTLYAFLSRCHTYQGTHVLLMSETKATIDGNLQALNQRLDERGLDKKYVITSLFQETLSLSRLALLRSWSRLVALLAQQDFVFIDDYAPIFKFIKLNRHTQLIQIWHAGVGFKAVGYARFGKEGSPDARASSHRQYDHVVVGSTPLIPVYQEVFALPADKFLPLGLPRIDSFLAADPVHDASASILEQHPDFKRKRRILFAPTYRGTGQAEAFYPADKLDLRKIFDFCGDEAVFLIKLHPFIKGAVTIPENFASRIFDVSDDDLNGLLHCADALITDYSSIIYEYSLLDRPMYFLAFDLEDYQSERGFHWNYEAIAPGPICRDLDTLLESLRAEDSYQDKREAFRTLGFDHIDPHNSDRLIDTILD
ncbi:MAG: CDP-glycerol glycerophosphotransferase family protein [Coriobacteriia bacterium]|nr:CDP-glycerol glycerophosphotransferase family protein [Coriobacteriia bacterium]